MAKKYWLMKCEPSAYSIEGLEKDGTTGWEGVRNFQARNFMRSMKKGDGVVFYASNADPSGATGIARVEREAYPDPYQFRKGHDYYDPESNPAEPKWSTVEIAFIERFPRTIPLSELRETPGLEKMEILRKGSRLSVTPLTKQEFEIVKKIAGDLPFLPPPSP
ncbi:MAG: EVE domain-containing protein [Thermoanaerobaculia bacterium]